MHCRTISREAVSEIEWLLVFTQAYKELLQEHEAMLTALQRSASAIQATFLMVLPSVVKNLSSNNTAAPRVLDSSRGIGFARLCNQLVAYGSGLGFIWMLDDTMSTCFELAYPTVASASGLSTDLEQTVQQPRQILLGEAMQKLESAIFLPTFMVSICKLAAGQIFLA